MATFIGRDFSNLKTFSVFHFFLFLFLFLLFLFALFCVILLMISGILFICANEIEMTNKVKRNLCEIDLVAFVPHSHLLCATISKEFNCYCVPHTHVNHILLFHFVSNAFCIFYLVGIVWHFSADKLFKQASQLHRETFIAIWRTKNLIMKFDSMPMQINDRAPQNEGKAMATTTTTRATQEQHERAEAAQHRGTASVTHATHHRPHVARCRSQTFVLQSVADFVCHHPPPSLFPSSFPTAFAQTAAANTSSPCCTDNCFCFTRYPVM